MLSDKPGSRPFMDPVALREGALDIRQHQAFQ
jgi:hypothetical protein